MVINAFNKKLNIDNELVRMYEDSIRPIDSAEAEYLIIGSGVNENASVSDTEKALTQGIVECINLQNALPEFMVTEEIRASL